jgi:fungal STAND N-terminal Goodbye domain
MFPQVFGPAELCFNAISYLIAIPGKVSKVYETLGVLFGKIYVFLSQFKIYERIERYSNVDTALKSTIHKLLVSFVNICGLYINRLKPAFWAKFRVTAKVALFDEDSGVGAELATFEALAQEQRDMVGTLSLEAVLDNRSKLAELRAVLNVSDQKLDEIRTRSIEIKKVAEEGFGVLIAADKGRKTEELKQQQLIKIEKKLGVKDSSTATPQANISDCVPDTGSWLDSIQEYRDWADRETTADPVLFLTGNENSGKSFLTSAIIRKLQTRYGQGDTGGTRTCVAYYFFPKGSEKADEKLQQVETALKWMSLQIAQDDIVYRKEMASLCDAKDCPDLSSLGFAELWEKLGFGSFKTNVTYYLLFEGVDQLAERMAKPFLEILSKMKDSSSGSNQLRLRVIVTGQEKSFGEDSLRWVPRINIGKHNQIDIEKYIDQQLEKMNNLQADSAEKDELRRLIRIDLPKQAQGDFFKVRYSLDAISKERWAEGITRILSEAGEDRDTILRKEIVKCNEKLSTEDIEDLNELLAWVVFGQWWLTVEQLETALFLRHDKTSLQPLKNKLNKEFSKFFEVDKDGVVSINTDMKDLVTKANEEIEPRVKELAPGMISENEIKMVKKFLWTFCDQDVFEKFGFDEFFAQKARTSATIGINEKDAHLTILKQSLKLLIREDDGKTKSLALYALAKLPTHLGNIADPTKLSLSDKTFIETALFKVLTNEDIVERRWQNDSELLRNWGDETTAVETAWRWLKNSPVVRALRETPESWLSDEAPNSNVESRVLRKVIRVMAKHWLRGREWEVNDAFPWVQSFATKVSPFQSFCRGILRSHNRCKSRKETSASSQALTTSIGPMCLMSQERSTSPIVSSRLRCGSRQSLKSKTWTRSGTSGLVRPICNIKTTTVPLRLFGKQKS